MIDSKTRWPRQVRVQHTSILSPVIHIEFTGKIDKEKVQQEECGHSPDESPDKTFTVGNSRTEVQQDISFSGIGISSVSKDKEMIL